MTPEDHHKARRTHENALCRKIWLKMAHSAQRDAGHAIEAWNARAICALMVVISIAGTCAVVGIWIPEIPWLALPIELLALERARTYTRTGRKTAQFWLTVRQQRLDYAEMYR